MTISAPRWDVSNIYPSLESKEFKAALEDYKKQVTALEKFFKNKLSKAGAKSKAKELAPLIGQAIDRINKIQTLSATIVPFIYAFVTTDSRDKTAMKIMSEFEQASLPMRKLSVQFEAWIGKIAPKLDKVVKANKSAAAHEFMLKESAEQSKYLMSDSEEGLAAEMSLSGGNAFEKLQGTVTSQLSVDFELDGKIEKLPMPALINFKIASGRIGSSSRIRCGEPGLGVGQGNFSGLPERCQGRSEYFEQTPRTVKMPFIPPSTRRALIARLSMPCWARWKIRSRCSANISKPKRKNLEKKNSRGGMSLLLWARPIKFIHSRKRAILSWRTLESSHLI